MHRLRLLWWSLLVAVPVLIQYAGRLSEEEVDRNLLYRYSTAIGAAVIYAIMLMLVLTIAGFSRELLALRSPRSWPRTLGLSAALFAGMFAVIAMLEQVLHGGEEQGLTPDGWQADHAGAYIANFVVIAVAAPIVEELTFRGLGYSLLEPFGRWTAIAVVGVVFALQHGLVRGFLALALFGCALAWLRARTESVYPCILLHSTFNSIALVVAVAA